jgi:modulator of FtsH protease HflK
MVDESKQNEYEPQPDSSPGVDQLDAAGKSLSEALRISFTILKVIMIVLIVAFLASGFRTVGPDEKALVLRFGRIKGVGDEAILGPGAHWVFPYPIDELVRIPVEKNINLSINTFWYKETRDDILGRGVRPRDWRPEALSPVEEGYALTRSHAVDETPSTDRRLLTTAQQASENEGSDYNIVHTRWQINYRIAGIEQFFRNVYMPDVKPGEVYFDVMTASIAPLLRSVVEDAIVSAMVHYTIDEVTQSADTIRRRVQQLVQQKLDDLESGIRIVQMQLVNSTWPRQVDGAFQAYVDASQRSQQTVTQARTYADTTLNKTAGRIAESLYRALLDDECDEQQLTDLWANATGDAQEVVARAHVYRTRVVEAARANANYFLSILPEYRNSPQLVARELYLTTIQEVMSNADEKFILEGCRNAGEREFRILLNRDTRLKPRNNR